MRTSSENYRGQLHGGGKQHRRENPGRERGLPAAILVADDSRTNLFLLQEILKGLGYRVATAGNGAEALQKARQNPPDLIVTDILMPVMDGFSLCWEWKHDERLQQIPLICYTGTYTDDQNREFALELGAERFVINTGNPEDLVKVIREVLESSRRGGPAAVPPPVAEDTVFLRQHNEILARKLEDKVRQLEQAQRGLQRDVAELKRAEETQARLAAIVEHSNDAIISRAIDGTITSWNAAAERLFGYSAAEVIGRDLVETFPPEARQQIAAIRNLVRTGQSLPSHEVVRVTKDGRRIDVTLSVSPIRDNSGSIIGIATIARDISEHKRAERILRNYAARLQTVSRKLLEVQEDERRRLARELHDQVGQVLTALKVNLQVIGRQPAAAPVALQIGGCAQIADAALQQVRTLMLDLRPPQLDELGLAVALRAHAERQLAPVKLALHFSAPAVLPNTPPAIEIVCFRIMQEALTNILRHAGARNVWIGLAAAGGGLELTVRDDGKGFDLAEAHARAIVGGSIGLLSMEERAALADGRIEISTAPGAGTTVQATFPLPPAQG